MSYFTLPSVVFTASAWLSPGPGFAGSVNGNAVAVDVVVPDGLVVAGCGAVGVVSVGEDEAAPDVELPPPATDPAVAPSLIRATGGSPFLPGTMKNAGCSFEAPSTGT